MTAPTRIVPMKREFRGVQYWLTHDNTVVYSDNWEQVTAWATAGEHGFRLRSGGPETYGHQDIYHEKGYHH